MLKPKINTVGNNAKNPYEGYSSTTNTPSDSFAKAGGSVKTNLVPISTTRGSSEKTHIQAVKVLINVSDSSLVTFSSCSIENEVGRGIVDSSVDWTVLIYMDYRN